MLTRQQLRLFKSGTLISFFVYAAFFIQALVVLPGNKFLPLVSLLLIAVTFLNYFQLNYHKKTSIAFPVMLGIWCLLIHIDTYYSGGIRNSANFYFAVVILTAYMLLGKTGGKAIAIFAAAHLVYFYIISTNTNWITYDLVGKSPALLDLYFFLSTTVSILALTFQAGYIERSKNEIIADINLGKNELKKSEEMLKNKNNALQRKNEELEQFAHIASHDLQEPLTTLTGMVQLLQRKYEGKFDKNAEDAFEFMLSSTARMKTLIKDLLDYSRLGYHGKLGNIDCNIMMKELLADLSNIIADTQATIEYDELPVITGFATEVKLLFQNLLINAMKFRKENVAPVINISFEKQVSFWHFAITDNGIGIQENNFEKIFVIFQRLHSQSIYKGSGIGLAHCKKIVTLHQGDIFVESVPMQGSTFHFTIYDNLISQID
ncbi:hypothetical protein BH11BAC3_BH11BAC3_21290 [soil metagenome]